MARRKFPWGLAAGGAAVVAAGAWLFKRVSKGGKMCSDDDYRAAVVAAAQSQVGKRELNTYFADAAPQFVNAKPIPEWCGIGALWCLHQAGLAKDKMWKTGFGFLLTSPRPMPPTSEPKPGDIAYFDSMQHHAVVLAVHDDSVELANFNGTGGVVSLSRPERTKAKAYYSIQPHIDAAKAEAGCS